MTAVQYALLFRIECLHEYFGGLCRSLSLAPTEDCHALLGRYRMLFRGSAGAGAVYAPQQSPPDLLRHFDESLPFTFRLISADSALESCTDLQPGSSAAPSESLFHFDNSTDQQAEVFGASRQLLHAPGHPFDGAELPVRAKMFSFLPSSSSLSAGNLQVVEPLTGQVLWQSSTVNPSTSIQLDLRHLPDGCYRLKQDGNDLLKFYLSGLPASQQWGAISIYAGGSRQSANLPANCRTIDSAGVTTPRTFTISLECRKAIWRYYLIDPVGTQDFSGYELTGTIRKQAAPGTTAPEIRFVRSPETRLLDGRTAWVFESQSPLPILQSPSAELSLMLRPGGNGKRGERVIRLPYAQPGSLVFHEGPGPRSMCAEIFVYV